MDLLLQAAKVLELEHSGDGSDRVAARSARGANFHQYAKSKDGNSESTDGPNSSYSESGQATLDESASSSERRRSGGAGTREVHNQLEKNRRKQLRECFNHLQQCVPSLENKRVATQSILQGAIKYIKHLKKKDVEQERDIQMLAKKKSELKKKYDIEKDRCSEDEQRIAQWPMKVKAEPPPVHEDDTGHTSDSTTTASEGPDNGDLSDIDDDQDGDGSYRIASYSTYGKVDGSRKRKLGQKSVDLSSGRNHGTIIRHGSPKHGQNTGLAAASSAMSASSSVALKQMLEQRKKQQVTMASLGPNKTSPSIPKSIAKASGGSLTSSYPMISGHLASVPKAQATPPVVVPNSTRSPIHPPKSSSDDHLSAMLTMHANTLRPSSADHVINLSTKERRVEEKGINVRRSSAGLSQAPAQLINSSLSSSFTSSSPIKVPNPGSVLTANLGSPMKPAPSSVILPSSSLALLQAHTNNYLSGKISNIHSAESLGVAGVSPFKTSNVITTLDSTSTNKASAVPTLHLPVSNTNTTMQTSQHPTSQMFESALANSKVMPMPVIPASLASLIRTLPLNSGLSTMAITLASPQMSMPNSMPSPVTIPSRSAESKTMSSGIRTTTGAQVLPPLPLTSSNTETMSVLNQSHLQPSINTINKNTRIATLLAAPTTPANSVLRPGSNLVGNTAMSQSLASPVSITLSESQKTVNLTPTLLPLGLTSSNSPAPTASITLSDSQKMISLTPTLLPPHISSCTSSTVAPTATITLSDAQKSMALTPTIFPLAISSCGSQTSTTASVIPAGTPLRFFAPLAQNSVMASLSNGQTHLMPTVVQLGASGQVAVLQNLIPAGPHPLIAQPIIVMTTNSTITTSAPSVSVTKVVATNSSSLL